MRKKKVPISNMAYYKMLDYGMLVSKFKKIVMKKTSKKCLKILKNDT